MDFEEFISETVESGKKAEKPKKTAEKAAEDIMAEFMPFVEADKQRGG